MREISERDEAAQILHEHATFPRGNPQNAAREHWQRRRAFKSLTMDFSYSNVRPRAVAVSSKSKSKALAQTEVEKRDFRRSCISA